MAAKIELEQTLPKKDFARILRELANALECSEPLALYFDDRIISIPPNGETRIEYSAKNGENAFELSMNWLSTH